MIRILKGTLVHTPQKDSFSIHPQSYLVITDGLVENIYSSLPDKFDGIPIDDFGDNLIIPGFCDLHTHAPQYVNIGIGYDEELLPWLMKYTFPLESRYADATFAEESYKRFINALWSKGTTRASVFATIHLPATRLLFDLFRKSGLGAYIGKVNMDRNAIPALTETTQSSLEDTLGFVESCIDPAGLVRPILTPRFVPSTTPELMRGLGDLAAKYDLPIQSHVSENRTEIQFVKDLHPDIASFTEVYDTFGLLRPDKTIMAHAVHLTDAESQIMLDKRIHIAHCPQSNFNMSSGIMPLRKYLDMGITLGLGSDVAGGHILGMPQNIISACVASNQFWIDHPDDKQVCLAEAFYLATKGSGSFFGKVGSFEQSFEADALVVDDGASGSLIERTVEERLQKFIYEGDERCILRRFVRGIEVACPFPETHA